MTSDNKREIVQYCKQINEKCEVDNPNLSFDDLKCRKWYLTILEILFPHFEQKIYEINQIVGEAKAIACIVQEINDLDQFEDLEIDAQKIAEGDIDEISNIVQVIAALLEIVTEEYEEGQLESEQEVKEHQKNNKQMFEKGEIRQKKSISDSYKPKSAQAIENEFEKSENSEEEQDECEPINPQIQYVHNGLYSKKITDEDQERQSDDFAEPYKKFPVQQQQQPKPIQKKQTNKMTSNNMELCKNLDEKKPNNKLMIDPEKEKVMFGSKTKKKLVVFPKSPTTLKKARSNEELALTRKIQQNMKTNKKSKKNNQVLVAGKSPLEYESKRKEKQYELKTKTHIKELRQQQERRKKRRDFGEKNDRNLKKVLNFKEEQLKKQREEYEESIKIKVSNQRELYIKKINQLILELEKEKEIQDKKDFKDSLIRENEEAMNKIKSLEEWYSNRLNMIKENRQTKNKERMLLRSGHKEIIGKIERELKKENENRLIQLTNKMRQEQDNIETDFEELKERIRKVYHKY